MTRRTIRFAFGLLAVGVFCSVGSIDRAAAQEGANVRGIQVVRAQKKMPVLKIGRSYTVLTKDGKVLSGTLTKQDAKSITVKLKTGKSTTVLRKDIEEIREVPRKTSAADKRLAELRKQQEKLRQQLEARRRLLFLRQGGRSQNPPSVRDDADPKDPKETVVLLSPRGPMIVEFAIYADGKPFRMMREAIVDDLLAVVKPKDGRLTWENALSDPRFSFGRYAYVARAAGSSAAMIRRYDVNGDGLVQREEVLGYIAQLGYGGAFNVRPSYSYQTQPDVKAVLDTNKDGMIDAGELKAAFERLKSRDADDNDLLTAEELGGGQRLQYGRQFAGGGRGMRLPTQSRTVYPLGPNANLTGLYHELVKHYGDGEKVVRRAAFKVDPKLFAALDLNKNGRLESGEMVAFHLAKPAVKLEVRIGTGPRVVVKSLANEIKVVGDRTQSEEMTISLPGWTLRLSATAGVVQSPSYGRTAESYITRYDTDKNGYLDEKELKAQGAAGRYALQQFKLWDANGDGKVYADEIKKSFERALAPQMSQVTLTERSEEPSLFTALDETGDGRISLREMRTAGRRLLALDRNKNGRIDPEEMPSVTSLTFDRGYGTTTYQFYNAGRPRKGAPRIRGPRWFYHMDKNGDGDVSLREFLGMKHQFQKLDTNGDGLIELKEAEAAGKASK